MRKPNAATVVASVALFFSLGAGAQAATGFRITSIWQIAPKVRHELRGARGPQGLRGLQGLVGPAGQPGAPATASLSPAGTYQSAIVNICSDGTCPSVAVAVAMCPIGQTPISGGFYLDRNATFIPAVAESVAAPVPMPGGWAVVMRDAGGGNGGFYAEVDCEPQAGWIQVSPARDRAAVNPYALAKSMARLSAR